MTPSAAGKAGEDAAARFLEGAGYRVVERNFRSRTGEIDLIALDGGTLVFVEVKAWSTIPMEDLGRSIGPAKRRRIVETAKFFLDRHREYKCAGARFDVVFVGPSGVRHLASAFTERV